MMKKILTMVGALLLSCSLPLSGNAASSPIFTDVPSTKHFAEAVNDLAERKIIGGYPDGTFKPGNSITRGQAAAIIAKMINLDTNSVKNPGFKDVSTANGYYKAIAAMAQRGFIGGYGDGRFGPNDPITRGQMASILVKSFDLPRLYDKNPFTDIKLSWNSSHDENVLIIYHLGITTGTTPHTFSPNLSITRGQAAKMLKATEEAKPANVKTIQANELGWNRILALRTEVNPGFFAAKLVEGKEGYSEDKVQLIPLKEGSGTLVLADAHYFDTTNYKKYFVHVTKENGELKVTLEETNGYSPTPAPLDIPAAEVVRKISLATMEGEKLSDGVEFTACKGSKTCIDIDKPGQYIATVQFASGKEARYGIQTEEEPTRFYYDVETLKEELTATYEQGTADDIGKHTIVTKGYEEIAKITRDTRTNRFTAELTGKKEGTIMITYENRILSEYYHQLGLRVDVKRIGSIWNVSISRDGYVTDI